MTDPLSFSDLRALATRFAAAPELWRPHVRADTERRACHPLLKTPEATVWLISWMPGHDTGFHDHDGAAGAVAVLEGAVLEERLRLGGAPSRAEHRAGSVVDFGPAVIHRVSHLDGAPAVTIHAYSPELRRMGAYVADASGELRRHAVDEDQELRADLEAELALA
jgi:predicted metal-dependent enzyme (double-stranded beta helix superfamily)